MSHPGTVANTHYDKSMNFVTQVRGRKRWLLFPPSEWPRLHLFPSLHRHYHQSRANLTSPDANADLPGVADAEAFEVTLEPGETLLVPPYWFHCVEALGPGLSLSVSVITPSAEEVYFGEAFWQAVPFVSDWPEAVRVKYVAEYIRVLIRLTKGAGDPSHFVRSVLLDSRWKAHVPAIARKAALVGDTFSVINCSPRFGELDSGLLSRFDETARETAEILNNIKDVDIRSTNLGNLVEELAKYTPMKRRISYQFLQSLLKRYIVVITLKVLPSSFHESFAIHDSIIIES
jgi:hypothetical protein